MSSEGRETAPVLGRRLFIDSCAVNGFARLNVDPVRQLVGTPFAVAITPALEAEYRRALAHRLVEPHIKRLLAALLAGGQRCAPATDPDEETDAGLVALTRTDYVVTLDAKPPWDRARDRPGLILWPTLEAALRSGEALADVLRDRYPRLGPF